ncbi:T9SS type A sorting domain-containing protein [Chondrinema litorale]|uniref:T9SS type A sorting domain-containing protein n=1 Tax=Chondrinema litorale TaxID=2994555 RepID=UPI002542CB9A|nr:T9SS type A sorting domain-containing protein [Chondrinema litorale]UZR95615.1 hypothetical protein OQ292_07300 [Chondrinema litorale]
MRLIRKAILSALLMIGSLNAAVYANDIADELSLTLKPQTDNSKLLLTVRNLKSTDMRVIIKNADNAQVYTKYVNEKDVYMEMFNFSRLNSGEYTFYIISGNAEVSQKFDIDSQGRITVANEKESVAITPDIRLRDGKVEVRLANRLKEAVSVSIYDEEGALVHFDEESKSKDYGKKFNLDKITKGSYTFKIESGAKSFEKVISFNE